MAETVRSLEPKSAALRTVLRVDEIHKRFHRGVVQNPMFGSGAPAGWAHALPGYGAGRVLIDAAFDGHFHAYAELVLGLAWAGASAIIVALVLRRVIGTSAER